MLKIIPLGGLGEIGLNMMVIEYDHHMLVVDAGLMFPEAYMPGVDVVIPDITYLRENADKLESIILTHGHEDHIGAMPFVLKEFGVPVYGTSFTIELLKEKLREHELLQSTTLHKIKAGDLTQFGPLRVEYIRVNHSVVDGVGLAIQTPEGIIVHSGDFRFDQTPLDGQVTDLGRFAYYGDQNVLLLFSDSTNVEKEGYTLSEKGVRRTLDELFRSSPGRVIVAVFASNIGRIQQVIDLALKYDRQVVFSGKSMRTNVRIAKDEGLLTLPDGTEISENAIEQLPDDRITILTTGSQGEPMSALTRMAHDRHKGIRIRKDDRIILSSRFIPGNEKAIASIINNLYRLGADVVYEKVSDIHTSGHAYREELKLMLNLVKPKFFIPIHGEYRHLVKHAQLALDMGIPDDRILLAENGDVAVIEHNEVRLEDRVHAGRILVDGKGVGDVGEPVLRDRRRLSGDGMVIALLAVDEQSGHIVYGPDIISRGFVFEDRGDFMLEEAKCVVLEVIDELEGASPVDWAEVSSHIKRRLKRFFYKIIERRPLILPIIIPV
jgi:ribonuclease J